jgi:hypothetical protein
MVRRSGAVNVACLNWATVDLGIPFETMIPALQRYYDEFFVPVWGYPLNLITPGSAGPSDWRLIFVDDATDADSLGFHDLTDEGQPVSMVFVKTTLADGSSVSVTASHEIVEMAIDPIANMYAQNGSKLYAYEVSDPVEEDTFDVDGVPMSNFVTPAWFEPFDHPVGTKFDILDTLSKPFEISAGGYASVLDQSTGKLTDIFGSPAKARRFAREDRRGHRSEFRRAAQGK